MSQLRMVVTMSKIPTRPEAKAPGALEPTLTRSDAVTLDTADSAAADLMQVQPNRYVITDELGRGGMGRVSAAWDVRHGRKVAVKELLATDPGASERFQREALMTARLQHPGIVTVYEAGRWPDGAPFYAMRIIAGRPLADIVRERKRLDERLALLPNLIAVGDAIAYAHDQRIIHRDLKPQNVMIGDFGETVIVDWGLAKDLSQPNGPEQPNAPPYRTPPSDLTAAGTVMGTPAYMAPEQAEGHSVDERADIYAFGAMLFFVLAGRAPFSGATPTEVLEHVATGTPLSLAELEPGVPKDLLAVVSRAMARSPAARYPSAQALVADLRQFQTGHLVSAHRYSGFELAMRFLRRNALLVLALAALLTVSAVGVVNVVRARDRADAARDRAEVAQHAAERQADDLVLAQASSMLPRDPTRAVAWLKRLSPQFNRWPAAAMIADRARELGVARLVEGHQRELLRLAFSSDGAFLASADAGGTVRLTDLATGRVRILSPLADAVSALAYAPDAQRLAVAGSGGELGLVDLSNGSWHRLRGHVRDVRELHFSADSQLLVSAGDDGTVRLWTVATREARVVATGAPVVAVALAATTSRFVWLSGHRLWESDGGVARALPWSGPEPLAFAIEADGRGVIAIAASGRIVRIDSQQRTTTLAELAVGRWAAVSQDGRFIASVDRQAVHIYDVGRRITETRNFDEPIEQMTFSPGGRWLVVGTAGGSVEAADLQVGSWHPMLGLEGAVGPVAISDNDTLLATAGQDRAVRVWPLPRGHAMRVGAPNDIVSAAIHPSGRWVAVSDRKGNVQAKPWNHGPTALGTAREIVASEAGQYWVGIGPNQLHLWDTNRAHFAALDVRSARQIAFAASDRRLAIASAEEGLLYFNLDAQPRRIELIHGAGIESVALAPDGERLAFVQADGQMQMWKPGETEPHALDRWSPEATCVAFSRSGDRLASGSRNGRVVVWTLATGGGKTLGSHDKGVSGVAFSPDDRLLASAGRDGTVRLWDLVQPGRRRVFRLPTAAKGAPMFSPGGELVGVRDMAGGFRLWDVASGEARTLVERGAIAAAITADHAVVVGSDGVVQRWPVDLVLTPNRLRPQLEELTNAHIDADGMLVAGP